MSIVAVVCEDHVGLKGLQSFEVALDPGSLKGKEAGPELLDDHSLPPDGREETPCAESCLPRPRTFRAQYDPHHVEIFAFAGQLQQRTATTDFDVVGMRTHTQDLLSVPQVELDHTLLRLRRLAPLELRLIHGTNKTLVKADQWSPAS